MTALTSGTTFAVCLVACLFADNIPVALALVAVAGVLAVIKETALGAATPKSGKSSR